MHPDQAVDAMHLAYDRTEHKTVPTGSVGLDYILGGGYPVGRCSEIYGETFTGKTTLALEGVRQMQKLGTVAYIDLAGDFNPDYAEAIGIDVDDLLVFHTLSWLCRYGVDEWVDLYDFIVVDGLQTKSDALYVERARQTVLAVSQVRTALSDPYRGTTGGYLEHASVRVRMSKRGDLYAADVSRNTYGNPGTSRRSCRFRIGPDGIDQADEVFGLAVQTGLIDTERGRHYFRGDYLGHGREAALRAVLSRPEGISDLEAALADKLW